MEVSGHAKAMSGLYKSHATALRGLMLSRVGCEAAAEDLVQETFIRLLNTTNFDEIKNAKSYMFRIALNLAIDYYRAKGRRELTIEPEKLTQTIDIQSESLTVEDTFLQKESVLRLRRAVGELSPLCQKIFWMSRQEGFRNYEIADMLGVCVSTVEKNISRATRRCLAV